mmetsp:Transcript_12625/g.28789  ORF Transcript_12625/g.28789 Transcript_12625/m.28789 type:complete len:224 (+) Transcript_12625:164-835(+)
MSGVSTQEVSAPVPVAVASTGATCNFCMATRRLLLLLGEAERDSSWLTMPAILCTIARSNGPKLRTNSSCMNRSMLEHRMSSLQAASKSLSCFAKAFWLAMGSLSSLAFITMLPTMVPTTVMEAKQNTNTMKVTRFSLVLSTATLSRTSMNGMVLKTTATIVAKMMVSSAFSMLVLHGQHTHCAMRKHTATSPRYMTPVYGLAGSKTLASVSSKLRHRNTDPQ